MNENDDFLYTLRADLPDDFARDLYARLQDMEQTPMQLTTPLTGSLMPTSRQRRTTPLIAFIAACAALVMCGLVLAFAPQGQEPFTQQLPITLNDVVEITDQNVDSLQKIMTLGEGTAKSLAWTPDGKHLAVGGSTGIHLHDVNDLNAPTTLFADRVEPVTQIMYSPDGTLLAGVHQGTLTIWDVTGGEQLHQFEQVTEILRFSSDSTRIAVVLHEQDGFGGGSYQFRILELATEKILKSITVKVEVFMPRFVVDGTFTWLAYKSGADNSMKLVNLVTDVTEKVGSAQSQITLSDDGNWMAILATSITVYNLKESTPEKTSVFTTSINTTSGRLESIPYQSPLLLVTPEKIQTFQITDEGKVKPGSVFNWQHHDLFSMPQPLVISPDFTRFATITNQSVIEIWDLASADQPVQRYEGYDTYSLKTAFNPSGTELISFNQNIYQGGIARRWDLTQSIPTATPLLTSDAEWNHLTDALYVNDAQVVYLAQIDLTYTASALALTIGEILHEFNVPTSDRRLSLDENGVVMVTSRNSVLRFPVDQEAQDVLLQPPAVNIPRGNMMLPGPVSPNGNLLPANVCDEYAPAQESFMDQCVRGAIRLWNTTTGEVVGVLSENASNGAFSMLFSADSRYLIAQQCTAQELTKFARSDYYLCREHELAIWDLSLLESPETPLEPVARISTLSHALLTSLAVSPISSAGKVLLAGSDFGDVSLWQFDPEAGTITLLHTIQTTASHITFNAAGTVLTAAGEGLIELWGTAEQ